MRARSTGHDDVVDLEDHTDTLGCKGQGRVRHQSGLHNLSLLHVHDSIFADIKASVPLSFIVLVSQLSHKKDGVHTGILSQSVGDQLQSFSVSTADVRVGAENLTRVSLQLVSNFHFDAGTSWHERSLLNKGSDDAEGIMEGTVSLIKHELVGASEQNGDSLTLVGAASDLDNFLGTTSADFLDQIGSSELLLGELINVSNGNGVDSSANEINFFSVNIFDDHNTLFGQEMKSKVAHSFSEDALLEQKHVSTSSEHLLNKVSNVDSLFLEETIDSGVVVDNNVALHVTLGSGQRELKETDFSVLNAHGATGIVRGLLVNENETINELGVVNGSSEFLGDKNVSEVDVVGGLLVDDFQDRVDSHRGKQVRVVGHDLR